jgi:hypothetical protein
LQFRELVFLQTPQFMPRFFPDRWEPLK